MNLVFLHGPAGAGKLTIAREVSALVGYPVFHNHLVVDLLTTVFPFGSEPFVRLRDRFWLDVFTDAAAADRSIVFTFAPENTVPPGFPDRAVRAVESHHAGGRVRFVRLLVGRAEQERRIRLPSRSEFHKLGDPGLLTPSGAPPDPRVDQPPAELEIDTERSTPEQAARAIVRTLALDREPSLPRYL